MKRSKPKTNPRRAAPTPASPLCTPQCETVLLAVTGMSPAVLTETVWALAHPRQRQAIVIPDRVIVLTTTQGAEQIRNQLLQPAQGGTSIWGSLLSSLQRDGLSVEGRLRFGDSDSHIRIFSRYDGSTPIPLKEVATEQDNEAVGDSILAAIWGEVEKPDTQIIASIAGGFKTMSALLMSCMSLIGRPEHRITHVLVDAPFDDPKLHPRFYFPSQPQVRLFQGDIPFSADKARVVLMDVPFVALRRLFAKYLVKKPRSYRELVAHCKDSQAVSPGSHIRKVVVMCKTFQIKVNDGQPVKLPPTLFMVTRFFAEARRENLQFSKFRDAFAAYADFLDKVLQSSPVSRHQYTLKKHSEECREDVKKSKDPAASGDADYKRLTHTLNALRERLGNAGNDADILAKVLPEGGRPGLDLRPEQIAITD